MKVSKIYYLTVLKTRCSKITVLKRFEFYLKTEINFCSVFRWSRVWCSQGLVAGAGNGRKKKWQRQLWRKLWLVGRLPERYLWWNLVCIKVYYVELSDVLVFLEHIYKVPLVQAVAKPLPVYLDEKPKKNLYLFKSMMILRRILIWKRKDQLIHVIQ